MQKHINSKSLQVLSILTIGTLLLCCLLDNQITRIRPIKSTLKINVPWTRAQRTDTTRNSRQSYYFLRSKTNATALRASPVSSLD